ncbi:uncharacterized protein FIBRA_07291 [Fibroporia radiculosa]|uniref:Macro-like domain-containing protein n=1 Tax=Fibroporia radiculosa TaxID=599839 RepID=J4H4J1_9APHY|nr:uncharacterized protein FIBRA_07291 [Fibroporia radiculosa]CCM05084.1 predicted protein [Fibroporia radiculosa]
MDDISFTLLDVSPDLVEQWRIAFEQHAPDMLGRTITVIESELSDLAPPASYFDCIVSPANSYGRLDGGFDHYLALALAPSDPDGRLRRSVPTLVAQSELYRRWRGYAPPGSCTLVPLRGTPCATNAHQCAYIALCPTMRVPQDVRWNREVVYNCVWSLLVALDEHNRAVETGAASTSDAPVVRVGSNPGSDGAADPERQGDSDAEDTSGRAELRPSPAPTPTKIRSVLMPGLATGTGFVSPAQCAQQTALAFKHFADAMAHERKWRSLSWDDAHEYFNEVAETYRSGTEPTEVGNGWVKGWWTG